MQFTAPYFPASKVAVKNSAVVHVQVARQESSNMELFYSLQRFLLNYPKVLRDYQVICWLKVNGFNAYTPLTLAPQHAGQVGNRKTDELARI